MQILKPIHYLQTQKQCSSSTKFSSTKFHKLAKIRPIHTHNDVVRIFLLAKFESMRESNFDLNFTILIGKQTSQNVYLMTNTSTFVIFSVPLSESSTACRLFAVVLLTCNNTMVQF